MSALQKFKTFFSKNVLVCLTVPMVVFSLLVPQPFVWMGQNISIDLSGIPFLKENFPSLGFVNMLLCVIMFGMGMTLKLSDFKVVFTKPKAVIVGICSQFSYAAACVFARDHFPAAHRARRRRHPRWLLPGRYVL